MEFFGKTSSRLVKIGPIDLEKKIFKFRQSIFTISLLSSFAWKRVGPCIWTNLNPFHPRMLCAKFGWNWFSGFGEEDENVKSLQTDGRTDRQTPDDRWSEKLTWAFSSGELKNNAQTWHFLKCFEISKSPQHFWIKMS